ncbi:hypothetical protein [Hymenobacter metallicola]|uniref:Uncharacterized protein n=1 Tax=Hymenobacter metallicola TaxID=2563114 RepID=A0A4Z0QCY2_9BACT|nr:hypothetical protein [Hymenobacter metallicola]TGE26901.1 hypothetical protein E5K02_10870 [Hymenobacter metallicola]
MPLLKPEVPIIEMPVSDRISGDTRIKQKARFVSFNHLQDLNGRCEARITVNVTLHAADGDGFGQPLTGLGFMSYNADLVADNNTVVDAYVPTTYFR